MFGFRLKLQSNQARQRRVFKIVRIPPSKKAVLIGCNYLGTLNRLYGCINDVNDIKDMITIKYGYKQTNINLITDTTGLTPTRSAILNSLIKLLKNSVVGDKLFFMFSGHGSYIPDINNDEITGNDECIYTKDNKLIVDDEFKEIINKNLKQGTQLFCIFDSCFSGTVMDLRYNYLDSLNNNQTTVNMKESLTKGNAIVLSSSSDIQTSNDAYLNNRSNGALTWAFIQVLKQANYDLTWHEMLDQVRELLSISGFTQLPQLSSSLQMDIESKISI